MPSLGTYVRTVLLAGLSCAGWAIPSLAQTMPQLLPVLYSGTSSLEPEIAGTDRFLVKLEMALEGGTVSRCTGAAVTKQIIITAGHCIADTAGVVTGITVQVRSTANPTSFVNAKAKSWHAHPDYNGGYDGPLLARLSYATAAEFHDIGIVVLEQPNQKLTPVRLTPAQYRPAPTDWMLVFGAQRDAMFHPTGQFDFARLINLSPYPKSANFRAGLKGGAAWCHRDSGGPVMIVGDGIGANAQPSYYLLGVAFAYFDNLNLNGRQELEAEWNGLQNVPGCGSRVGFSLIGPELPWLQQVLAETLPDPQYPLELF